MGIIRRDKVVLDTDKRQKSEAIASKESKSVEPGKNARDLLQYGKFFKTTAC